MNTSNGNETLKQAKQFYLGPNQQQKFLSDHAIDYVYFGIKERGLWLHNNLFIDNPPPLFSNYLPNNDVIIYRLDKVND